MLHCNPSSRREPTIDAIAGPRDPAASAGGRARPWPAIAVALLILLACWRVAETWTVFSQTWDEPAHIAAGMEWLDRRTYQYDPLHPPLARVLAALGPYLAGHRSHGYPDAWQEGNAILHDGGRYFETLALARAGILPFLILAALVVFSWTRRLYGTGTALLAVALLTTLPAILGHSGLATTDLAIAATLPLALAVGWRWLARPSIGTSIGLGAAIGTAVLSKLSALVFLPAGALAVWLCHTRAQRNPPGAARRSRLVPARFVYGTALLLIWAGYRFSIGPLATAADVPLEQRAPAPGEDRDLYRRAHRLAQAPVYPAAELFQGLAMLRRKNQLGQKAYLLGEVRTTGWWYYYPLALGVKTPLAFLVLASLGVAALWREPDRARRWSLTAPILAAAAILLSAMPSRINIGSRHILPVYVLLSIPAAAGCVALWRWRPKRWVGPAAAGALLAWQVGASVAAAPDYTAWSNELAADRSDPVLVDGDLDNGQDLERLADALRAQPLSPLWIAYAGSADLDRHGLPPFRLLPPRQRVTGWVAISLFDLKLGPVDVPTHDDFAWLEAYRPRTTIGKSIRLYYIPADGTGPDH